MQAVQTKTARVASTALVGFDGQLIEVECDLANNLPTMVIVGLGTKSVDEAKDRVRSAITNSGLKMPKRRVTLNLAPADIKKDGSCYDLPIAVAILLASKQITGGSTQGSSFIGELGLDGRLMPVYGVVSHLLAAKSAGLSRVYLPHSNIDQASLIDDLELIPVKNLRQLYMHLREESTLSPIKPKNRKILGPAPSVDFKDIYGQNLAKRALEISAGGGHNVLMNGPPGAGKTLLGRALAGILPPMSRQQIIESTSLYSLAGLNTTGVVDSRPFRSPHHSASHVALTGGGSLAGPGEISLAHNGILFLDELPEFSRHVLESLRQPLEDKQVTVARAQRKATYPADFMLVATQNPCPCGYHGDPQKECLCSPYQIIQYNKKISGPLLDRIDMVFTVNRVEIDRLLKTTAIEPSVDVARRVSAARLIQTKRLGGSRTNSLMTNDEIKTLSLMETGAKNLLTSAAQKLLLSGRAYFRTIKVARTIADLAGSKEIRETDMSEALQYRPRQSY